MTAQIADALHAGADAHGVETVALRAAQEIHWTIHRAFTEYAEAAEERRRLAATIGEDIRALVDVLTEAGWSEQAARNADVAQLASAEEADGADRSVSGQVGRTGHWPRIIASEANSAA